MGQVTVTLNGRTYRLRCGDGEEERVIALADHVRSKLDGLVRQFGQPGHDRLLLMSALLIADELWDTTAKAQPGGPFADWAPAGRHNSAAGTRVLPTGTEPAD